jgi:hypothetical protein
VAAVVNAPTAGTGPAPGGPRFPASWVWDGDPLAIVQRAAMRLGLAPTAPEMPALTEAVDAVIELTRSYLDWAVPFDDVNQTDPIPSVISQSVIQASCEAFRRRETTFGIIGGSYSDQPLRISADWLIGVVPSLVTQKHGWGVG